MIINKCSVLGSIGWTNQGMSLLVQHVSWLVVWRSVPVADCKGEGHLGSYQWTRGGEGQYMCAFMGIGNNNKCTGYILIHGDKVQIYVWIFGFPF